jgi:exodeoxyribonuclease VIII
MDSFDGVLGGVIEEIRPGVPFADYLDISALNPSTLCHGLKSMRHLLHVWNGGSSDSKSKQWGRAIHCMLFEPREFEKRYVKCNLVRNPAHSLPGVSGGSSGKEPLTVKEYDSAITAAESFLESPEVVDLIDAGVAEVTLLTVENEMQCKGRVDWLRTSHKMIVDLKSVRNIEARRASRDFYNYHYDVKLGLYQRWARKLTGDEWPVKIIWIENQEPYDVAVMPIDNAVLDRGARKGLGVIDRVKECVAADQWPGVAGDDFLLYVPSYEMDDEDVDYEGVAA